MLIFEDITKIFKPDFMAQPFRALDKVTFQIPSGSMVGFLGANGAGKTTSLKIIMDFIRPTEGRVKFAPELGLTTIDVFRRIGFLPERPYFYPNLTGREFLEYLGKLSELSPSMIRQQIKTWAPRFKIEAALDRQLKTYSKGMLQRIGFLSTVLHDPEFIILDEPLSGLDPIGRKELKDVIVDVHRSGKTVFFSSHIVSDIEEICDRVVFLKDGTLAYDGTVESLILGAQNSSYTIKYRTPTDHQLISPVLKKESISTGLHSLVVTVPQKDKVLQELMANSYDVTGVELIKPSLEEIFYNIRSK